MEYKISTPGYKGEPYRSKLNSKKYTRVGLQEFVILLGLADAIVHDIKVQNTGTLRKIVIHNSGENLRYNRHGILMSVVIGSQCTMRMHFTYKAAIKALYEEIIKVKPSFSLSVETDSVEACERLQRDIVYGGLAK